MTIGSIGGSISNAAVLDMSRMADTSSRPAGGQHRAAAQLFGESPSQLWTDLRTAHTSMSGLATARGISQSDLIDALKQGLARTPANSGLTDAQLTDMANTIANRVHGGQHHAAAQVFGESGEQLFAELKSGQTSMSALATARGISQTDLINGIKHGLANSPAYGALTDTQLTDLATTIANRVHGVGGAPGGDSAAATPSAVALTGAASTARTDVERLTFAFQSTLHTATPGAPAANPWTNAAAAGSTGGLSQFDLTL